MFQIWGWYLKKKKNVSKILFGRSTKFSPLDASKTPLVHTVGGFVICSRVFLFQILQAHTQFFLWHTYIHTTLWHPYQHTHTIIAALFINWLYNMQKQENRNKASICFIGQTWKNGTIWLKKWHCAPIGTFYINGTVIKNSSFNGFQWGHFCP